MANKQIVFTIIVFLSFVNISSANAQKIYTLKELINIAEKNNPAYQSLKKELEAKKCSLSIVRKYPNPVLSFGSDYGKSTDTKGREYSVSLEQPIVTAGKIKYKIESKAGEIRVENQRLRQAKEELDFKVKEAFYRILYLETKLRFCNENIHSLQKILSLARKGLNSTQAEFAEYKIKSEILQADNEKEKTILDLKDTKDSLNKFLNNTLENSFKLKGEFKFFSQNKTLNSFLKQAKTKNPLFLKEAEELMLRDINIKLEKAGRFPDLSIGGFFSREIDKKTIGLGISFPLPLWNNNSAQISRAVSLRKKAKLEKKAYENELIESLKRLYRENKILIREKKLYQQLLKQTEKTFYLSELLYKQAKIGLFSFLDSNKEYLNTKDKYYQILYKLAVTSAKLEEISGVELK